MIISTMSAEWRTFDEKQKEKYQKMADEDKLRYNKEKKEYDKKKEEAENVSSSEPEEKESLKDQKKVSKKKASA